jgi:hypothetical protein
VKKPATQPLFQLGDTFPHRGFGDAQPVGGEGKTSSPRGGDKNGYPAQRMFNVSHCQLSLYSEATHTGFIAIKLYFNLLFQ